MVVEDIEAESLAKNYSSIIRYSERFARARGPERTTLRNLTVSDMEGFYGQFGVRETSSRFRSLHRVVSRVGEDMELTPQEKASFKQ